MSSEKVSQERAGGSASTLREGRVWAHHARGLGHYTHNEKAKDPPPGGQAGTGTTGAFAVEPTLSEPGVPSALVLEKQHHENMV